MITIADCEKWLYLYIFVFSFMLSFLGCYHLCYHLMLPFFRVSKCYHFYVIIFPCTYFVLSFMLSVMLSFFTVSKCYNFYVIIFPCTYFVLSFMLSFDVIIYCYHFPPFFLFPKNVTHSKFRGSSITWGDFSSCIIRGGKRTIQMSGAGGSTWGNSTWMAGAS
jgi:hypothetical protein